jgi:hypothetical protein
LEVRFDLFYFQMDFVVWSTRNGWKLLDLLKCADRDAGVTGATSDRSDLAPFTVLRLRSLGQQGYHVSFAEGVVVAWLG